MQFGHLAELLHHTGYEPKSSATSGQDGELEEWKHLDVGGGEGVNCEHMHVIGGEMIAKTFGVAGRQDLKCRAGDAQVRDEERGQIGYEDGIRCHATGKR